MSSPDFRRSVLAFCAAAALLFLLPSAPGQSTSGRIIGRVSDTTGAVVSGVNVTIVNQATGESRSTKTNDTGDFTFVEVTPGNYHVAYALTGFKREVRSNVVLELNQVLTLNAVLQPGGTQETVDVTSEAPLVDTTSTQLGAVVGERAVTELPLNTRDTYQFLQLQPGVMSTVGSSNTLIYGSDSPGAVSVNGGRGRSNNFSVNGGDANDLFVNLPTVQPSPDSIEEFRVLTNTFDAEYGRNSGSVVNVITKSGTNDWHGNVYEFFRNRALNANGYFDTTKPQFNQNQFGGTLGGPIRKNQTFFFMSYEGRRIRQGIPSPVVTVPTAQERPSPTNVVNGQIVSDFSDLGSPFTGTLSNPSLLANRTGCQAAITAIGGGSLSTGDFNTIFPHQQIPLACMDPTAVDLLQFVPTPSSGSNTIETVPTQPVRGDQATLRLDHRINAAQNLTFYYYFDDDHTVQPFADFQLAGADVPGFGSIVRDRYQQYNFTHDWTLSNTLVNEFRFVYNREGQETFQHPQNTELIQDSCPPAPSWLTSVTGPVPCFYGDTPANSGPGATGIHPFLGPNHEGLPFISVAGGFSLGNNAEGELPQVGNSFQWSDNLTKVSGTHTMKFGADVRRQRFDQTLYYNVNGEFSFVGGSANDVGAADLYPNFLLGMPDSYGQGSAQTGNFRSTSLYLFAQDSWKIKPNLTLNYGLRWELNTPLADVSKHVETFRPGQSSTVYPCGGPNTDCSSEDPIGLVVPGDKGIPTGMTQTYYNAFAPRIGIAWSPDNGKTSIRSGWGLFYNPIEQLVLEQFGAEPPFGGSEFPAGTQFDNPFLGQDGVTTYLNPFNGIITPTPGNPQDWAKFEPILLFGEFQPHLRAQYSAQYNFTIQRELANDMKLEIGYVGSQGHRLLASHDLNYGNAQTCLGLQALENAYPGNGTAAEDPGLTCGPFYADSEFTVPTQAYDSNGNLVNVVIPQGGLHLPYGPNGAQTIPAGTLVSSIAPAGITLVGLRHYSSPQCNPLTGTGCPVSGVPVFSSIFAEDTIANSAYNSLQVSVEKRFSHGVQFNAAYTLSKSIDEASSFEGVLNPLPGANNRALSLFDARHRFVVSYDWALPVRRYSGMMGKLLDDWSLSGITTFQTGFPIQLSSSSDNELMYSAFFQYPGLPDQLAPLHRLKPQDSGNYFFDPNSFTENATTPTTPCTVQIFFGCYDPSLLGRIGDAPRTICCGPGISETDFAVLKNIPITEQKYVEFRAEFFNLFNHTQFYNPDGYSSDGTQFGQVTQAKDPRLVQFALKLFF
jgi:Carboxypeptidase regulatory-like domain/TonB dependent receptor